MRRYRRRIAPERLCRPRSRAVSARSYGGIDEQAIAEGLARLRRIMRRIEGSATSLAAVLQAVAGKPVDRDSNAGAHTTDGRP